MDPRSTAGLNVDSAHNVQKPQAWAVFDNRAQHLMVLFRKYIVGDAAPDDRAKNVFPISTKTMGEVVHEGNRPKTQDIASEQELHDLVANLATDGKYFGVDCGARHNRFPMQVRLGQPVPSGSHHEIANSHLLLQQ